MEIRRLKNGIRVVVDHMNGYRSAACGVWVQAGSADETDAQSGVSHFIEHMCFKGTQRRSALDIATETDELGAKMNAFTSKECTCYHARVTADKFPQVADILCDIAVNSVFDAEELEREKGVVIEEINMTNDTPDDLVHEVVSELYFGANPLGSPILGTTDTVRSFKRADLADYVRNNYTTDRIVVSVAGAIGADEAVAALEPLIGGYGRLCGEPRKIDEVEVNAPRAFRAVGKEAEQVQICLGLPGFAYSDERRYPLMIVNNAMGGTMSSRLFQKIREQMGLAYSVYSYPSCYTRSGMFTVYAGTGREYGCEVTQALLAELKRLGQDGITKEEFNKNREQLRGSYILSMESTHSVMNQNGKELLLLNDTVTEQQEIDRMMAATLDQCNEVAAQITDIAHLSAAFVGSVGDEQRYRDIIG